MRKRSFVVPSLVALAFIGIASISMVGGVQTITQGLTSYSVDIDDLAINGSGGADVVYTVPANTFRVHFSSRSDLAIRVAYGVGEIAAGDYAHFPGATRYQVVGFGNIGNIAMYFRGNTAAADTLEIEIWKRL